MNQFQFEDITMDKFYYIVHLLDKVLVGEYPAISREYMEFQQEQFQNIKKAIEAKTIIEAHFFNEDQELFVVQEDGELLMYEPLVHEHHHPEVITRYYQLENYNNRSRWKPYRGLVVKEYIQYDEDTQLAYVEKTILCSLLREGGV